MVDSLHQVPGVSVLDISQVGFGCPDLLVASRYKTVLVELKSSEKEELRKPQEEFRKKWVGQIIKATTLNEILIAIGVLPP